MKNFLILSLFICVFITQSNCQQIQFAKVYDYFGVPIIFTYSFIELKDSGFILARGSTNGTFAFRIDKYGDTIWTKSYTNPPLVGQGSPEIWHIDDAGSNRIFCGLYNGHQGFILVDGSNGDTIWWKNEPPPIQITGIIYEAKKTSYGGFAYCGQHKISQFEDYTVFVKLDSLCNTIYTSVIDPNQQRFVSFFPNPASSSLFISASTFANETNVFFSLTDMQGKQVLQQQYDKTKAVDVGNIPNGIYIGEVSGKQKVVRGKVVVQH